MQVVSLPLCPSRMSHIETRVTAVIFQWVLVYHTELPVHQAPVLSSSVHWSQETPNEAIDPG